MVKQVNPIFWGDHFEVSPMTLITIGSTKFLIKDIKYTE